MGFSSVQDFTRVMYSTVVNNNLQFSLSSTPDVQLSSEAEARYIKQLEEFEKDKAAGKVQAFSDPDVALKFLHSL